MKNTDFFKGKKITIVGLARSGLVCANLLHELGAKVSVTDNQDNDATRANAAKLTASSIKVELGKHTIEFIKEKDTVVISPGVQNKSLPVVWAEQLRIPIISEIEVGCILCPATIIAVTGSNGKTTVTTLIGRVLEAAGKRVTVCGNIGNPFCGELSRLQAQDFVSLEVSSFQLERIRTFKPKIALLLNLTPNHLDRYSSMEEYITAKKRIFMNQDASDYLVLNRQDPVSKELAKEARCAVIFFSADGSLNPNQAAVLAVSSILGIDRETALRVFSEFKGIEHRLEFVGEIDAVTFINDSKATTADSALWALSNLPGPIVLIAGGKHKGIDYRVIVELARQKVKHAVLIGEARGVIAQALRGIVPIEEAGSLEEAVHRAFDSAGPGDYVLLSPMCSSFDMFSSYEERGKVFKKAVYELIKKEGNSQRCRNCQK